MNKNWSKILTSIGAITGTLGLASAHHTTIKQMEMDAKFKEKELEINAKLKEKELNLEDRKQDLVERQFEFEKEKWYKMFEKSQDSNDSSLNTQTLFSQSKESDLSSSHLINSHNTFVKSINELDLFDLSSLNLSQFVGFVELLIASMVFLSLFFLLMEYILDKTINKYEDKLPRWLKYLSNLRSKFIFINQLFLIFDLVVLLIFNLLYGLFLFIYHHNHIVGSAGISIFSFSILSLIGVYGLFMELLIDSKNNEVKDKLLQFKPIQRLINYYKKVNEVPIKTYIIKLILSQLILIVFSFYLYLYGVV